MENEKKPYVMINKKIGNTEEWLWPASDKEAFQILESEWPALEKAINFYVPNLRVAFQAGGNCGMYPKLISEKAQIVYTAEPDPTNFFCLSYNCRQENIIKMQMAIGAEAGSVSVAHISADNCGMHRIHGEGAIPMLPLSAFNFPMLDLIQLDIEEYEINALKGAYGIIDQHRPVIILENATDKIKQIMNALDYTVAEEITRLDTVFVPNKK